MELGIGIGWRPEIADTVERLPGLDWVEVVAENVCPGHLPDSLVRLRERGVRIVPHGVSLGIGGADRPSAQRLADLAARAEALGSPLVTEHIAFVRAGGELTASPALEAGHLLPVPRTRDALAVLCENVRIAQDSLPVPLALENIAALVSWPGEEMSEGRFLAELVERTGVKLLVDVANLHTNRVNRGEDPYAALDELPVEAIAYVHVAGGIERDGVWHDTHAHPVTRPVLDILAGLRARVAPPGVLLERDDDFPPPEELAAELSVIRTTLATAGRTAAGHVASGASANAPAGAVTDAPGAGARDAGATGSMAGEAGATGSMTGEAGATGSMTGEAGATGSMTGEAGATGSMTGKAGATGDPVTPGPRGQAAHAGAGEAGAADAGTREAGSGNAAGRGGARGVGSVRERPCRGRHGRAGRRGPGRGRDRL
ncbi:DUF692 domain-containing protein, partial [Streptomyces sp. t39]|uniref:DUF692 domain-containing protein n=1 Tax=Streptomyces sp. t39 TaxID=1828156 RepID=UPI0021C70F82